MGEWTSSVEKMVSNLEVFEFFKGKRVFVTGHTGFKGSWLCSILLSAGAEVTGYSLAPPTNPSLFDIIKLNESMTSIIANVCDFDSLTKAFNNAKPEIVIHLAAQPIVRVGYKEPRDTYETNVMGTVNLLECCRLTDRAISVLNVTTDKVYENKEWTWGYRENENLNGFDPYSNSKSCSEIITHCYMNSFFSDGQVAISTARAGNVIGGGDFATDRIIPDCVRAAISEQKIIIRNPDSIRPYQHVLEPLFAYLMIARAQYIDRNFSGFYNVGPNEIDCVSTGNLVDLFCLKWGGNMAWVNQSDGGPHEANFLKLDCSKLKSVFRWEPVWNIDTAVEKTVQWFKTWATGEDILQCTDEQILAFMKERTNV